ncbi:prolipoprotein diacylglyceryl transferase family protein [Pseudomonas sp. nanlin1]|uniref:prolipoprotein diacylglyceryl transferase family protein n=1 Tax=Pseudomonas sp. nanlin1 TaxID=3040605 RepID=UPI003890AE5C
MLSLNVGPFALALNHLLLLLALVLATVVGGYSARRGHGQNPEGALFMLLLVGVLVARISFVWAYRGQYWADPWQAVDLRDGGFLLWPGVAAALLGGCVYAWRQPGLRRPLAHGVLGGLTLWGMGLLAIHLYERNTALPDIVMHDAAGQAVDLRSLQGRPLVVNLWATWCPPCRREMPVLIQAQAARPDVRFVYVNQGESPASVNSFVTAAGLQLQHVLFDPSGQLGQAVGSRALPTTLFYGADGRLLGNHLGELSAASLDHALELFEP